MEKRGALWIFFGIFLGLVVVVGGIYFFENQVRETASSLTGEKDAHYTGPEGYNEIQKSIDEYEAAMEADTYGGKTAEETLRMFIDALRNNDAELAAKYTLLDMKGSRGKWIEEIQKKKDEGKLGEVADILSKAVYDASSSYEGTAWFNVLNKDGMADYSALLKLNKYSGVWKIEEM